MIKASILFPTVFYHKVVCLSFFEQGRGDGVLSTEVLLKEQGRQRFIYPLKFAIEGTVAKGDLGNNRFPFDIVVVVK